MSILEAKDLAQRYKQAYESQKEKEQLCFTVSLDPHAVPVGSTTRISVKKISCGKRKNKITT